MTVGWLGAGAFAATPWVGVYGDFLTHPGVAAREEIPVGRSPASLDAAGLVYWHPGLMTAFELSAGPSVRMTGGRRSTYGAFAHLGVMRGFWTAPTWSVDESGVRRVPLAGDLWGTTAFGVGLGRVTEGWITGFEVRPQVHLRFPTFHGVGIDPAIELSVRVGGRT